MNYLKILKALLSIYIMLTFTSNSIAYGFIDNNSKKHQTKNIINKKNIRRTSIKTNTRSNKMPKEIKRRFPTGIERDLPITIITRKEFNDGLQNSPLWVLLNKRGDQDFKYGVFYHIDKSIDNKDAYSRIVVESQLDIYNSDHERLTRISYSLYNNSEQPSHKISNRQLSEIKELLKIVIKNLDDKEAWRIIENLYAQYNKKLANKDFIQNGMILAHTEYDGKIIAFYGVENDALSMFRYMEIT